MVSYVEQVQAKPTEPVVSVREKADAREFLPLLFPDETTRQKHIDDLERNGLTISQVISVNALSAEQDKAAGRPTRLIDYSHVNVNSTATSYIPKDRSGEGMGLPPLNAAKKSN